MSSCSGCSSANTGSCDSNGCSSCSSCGVPQKTQAQQLSNIKNVIVVMSGKGGVGKSSFTSMIAITLQKKGYKVGILDADITGPSIPKLFGISGAPQMSEFGAYPPKSANAIAVPITEAVSLPQLRLTAVPQPMRTSTIVPIISAKYFFKIN